MLLVRSQHQVHTCLPSEVTILKQQVFNARLNRQDNGQDLEAARLYQHDRMSTAMASAVCECSSARGDVFVFRQLF
ncbi:hypothetical protein V5799_033750 [Amblyomma americanum]|uniref:Uncharacterized protein n=1 Tax=Amblyomma americanum TaxID=6943 RepID=A0AAQ4DME8_AMBAM